jgi:KaiC/GvpD/RAD55 family RecA-like ATPase
VSNKAGAAQCRVCGEPFRERKKDPIGSNLAVLERVLSSEAFAAILQPIPEEVDDERAKGGSDEGDRTRMELSDADRLTLEHVETVLRSKGERAAVRLDHHASLLAQAQDKDGSDSASLTRAVDALRRGDFEHGLKLSESAIRDGAKDPRFWLVVGEASLGLGRVIEAAGAFRTGIHRNPGADLGWLGLGKVLRRLDEASLALRALDRAIELNGQRAETWLERGLALERTGRVRDALVSIRRAVEIRPDVPFLRGKRLELESRILCGGVDKSGVRAGPYRKDPPVREPSHSASQGMTPFRESLGTLQVDRGPSPSIPMDSETPRGHELAYPAPVSDVPEDDGTSSASRRAPRLKTYIDGLDELLQGGIPWGHVILVQGLPGTMKSSLCLAILYNQAVRAGRRCVYLSLEERTQSLLRQITSLGLRLHGDRGSMLIADRSVLKDLLGGPATGVSSLMQAVGSIQAKGGLDLLVIDSLPAMDVLSKYGDHRAEVFHLFDWLRDLDVTSFVILGGLESSGSGQGTTNAEEFYLADGIIQLRMVAFSECDVERQLRILKMRGTRHETGYHTLKLEHGRFLIRRPQTG